MMQKLLPALLALALLPAPLLTAGAGQLPPLQVATPNTNDNSNRAATTGWTQATIAAYAVPLSGGTLTGVLNAPLGLSAVAGAAPNSGQLVANGLASSSSSNTVTVKNGPNGTVMLKIGGSNADIEPQVPTVLPGLTFTGTGDQAPITLNGTFSGTTTSGKAGFGLYLTATDNSNCESSTNGFCDVIYSQVDLGASTQGHRNSGMFVLNINAPTLNTSGYQYSALRATANVLANDAPAGSPYPGATVFALNTVAHLKAGITATQINSAEHDTWTEAGSVMEDRINTQFVDVLGNAGAPTYGGRAIRDDTQAFFGAQFPPCFFTAATATQSGTTLTVTGAPASGSVGVGCVVTGVNIATPENITALGSGTGGTGTYTTNVSQTAASGSISGISGHKTVITFGRAGGFPSVAPTGTLIGLQGNLGARVTLANGIDWSLGDASAYWLQFGTVASLTGAGVLSATGYKVGATSGVTCAGTPTASFAASNGIITHC